MRELEEWRSLKFTHGVVPDLVDASEVADGNLGGWYESDTERLVVVMGKEGKGSGFTRGVQLHEIFHALQDQNWDLSALHHGCQDADQERALQGVIEGEAMLAVSDIMSYDFSAHAKFPSEGTVSRDRFEKIFHYGTGLEFIAALREAGGWEAVNAMWADPPRTSAEIYHPERYIHRQSEPANPVPTQSWPLPSGEVHSEEIRGEFDLRWLLVEFEETREHAASLGADLRASRYLEWTPQDESQAWEHWTLEFGLAESAMQLESLAPLLGDDGWDVSRDGKRVTLERILE